jgi:pyruvate dehydrogenase E2 component (dihydrolipoamide acetyltransferase)
VTVVSDSVQVFRLPDAGEGLTEADIVTWRVRPGDVVAVNDPLVDIETAKSLVELPSPFAGTVTQLLVAEGETVAVGTPIIAVDTSTAAGARSPVLVGYGPRAGAPTSRRRPATGRAPEPEPAVDVPVRALAKPPVRKLARDLGVDVQSVTPTGPAGVVTRADVERAAAQRAPAAPAPAAPVEPQAALPARPAGPASGETRIPVKGVRRATAAAMVASAFTAPHVTEWVQVDVSRSVKLAEQLRGDPAFEGVKVSPLLLVAKALLLAVRRHPQINATWDGDAGEIVVKHAVHLGIAVATPRGLLVPNVKDADRLGLRELADALAALTAAAREGRTPPGDLTGGTITITNVGVFGVDGGTPILNPGESAILAVGAIRRLPWVHRGKVRPRWVTTLSLSFDHRVVDGDLGSAVLSDVAAVLEHPARALSI